MNYEKRVRREAKAQLSAIVFAGSPSCRYHAHVAGAHQ
jgi:hypothetical protein